jgi:hypothetical protein
MDISCGYPLWLYVMVEILIVMNDFSIFDVVGSFIDAHE